MNLNIQSQPPLGKSPSMGGLSGGVSVMNGAAPTFPPLNGGVTGFKAKSPDTRKLMDNPSETPPTEEGKKNSERLKDFEHKIEPSESYLNYVPSKRQMRRMTREELLVLKKFLKSHVLKEAMENRGMENIQKFAKDAVSKVTNIPKLISVFYPEFINDSLDATYNVILNSTDTKDSNIPTLVNLKSTVQNSLDETMKLLNQSSDWISIILSKSLAELNASLSTTKLGSLNVGKFFSISALAASVVYIMTKLFKSGFNNPETFSECVKLFKNLYLKKSKTFKEGIDEKLNEYMNKEVPSNVITLNSLITKAFPLAQGMLFNIGYDEGKLSNLPTNVLILTEVCCAIVIFYTELIGKKFKSMAEKGKMKAFISNNLLMKMDNAVNGPKDIFSNLSDFKNSDEIGGDVN